MEKKDSRRLPRKKKRKKGWSENEQTDDEEDESVKKAPKIIKKVRHSCEKCFKTFSRTSILMRHMDRVHLKESHISCPHCRTKFEEMGAWEEHIKENHPPQTAFVTSDSALQKNVIQKDLHFEEETIEDSFSVRRQNMVLQELKYYRILWGALQWNLVFSALMGRPSENEAGESIVEHEIFFFKTNVVKAISGEINLTKDFEEQMEMIRSRIIDLDVENEEGSGWFLVKSLGIRIKLIRLSTYRTTVQEILKVKEEEGVEENQNEGDVDESEGEEEEGEGEDTLEGTSKMNKMVEEKEIEDEDSEGSEEKESGMGSFMKIPDYPLGSKLKKTPYKNYTINVENDNSLCLKYCIILSKYMEELLDTKQPLNKTSTLDEYLVRIIDNDIEYPIKICDIESMEIQNSVSINIFVSIFYCTFFSEKNILKIFPLKVFSSF